MDIQVTHSAEGAAGEPTFPMIRFDTGRVVYQEALVNGQYVVANVSAMGRPKPRDWVWESLAGGAFSVRPLRRRQHAFQIQIDGQLLIDRWAWAGDRLVEATRPGCSAAVVELQHTLRPIRVQVHTQLDDTPFLVRWLVITNTGDRPAAVAEVFPWSGQVWEVLERCSTGIQTAIPPEGFFSLGRFTETALGSEGAFSWQPLPGGLYGFESLHGRSGWGLPFFIVRNEATGELLAGHLAWSGNWRVEFFNDHEAERPPTSEIRLYARVGLAGPPPLRILDPGESVRTPAVHLGFLFGDLDACVQALHTHERRSVILAQPAGREHLVEVNHCGYTRGRQITQAQVYEYIDVAADVGAELFMLDAGWFGEASQDWFQAVGDYGHECPSIPGGVNAIFDHARARGLLCGLWVEAERMGAVSQLLRDHPDWQMERRGEEIANLDLSRPEIAQHVEDTIVALIEKYRLDCFRLDYNVSIGEGGEAVRGGYAENVLWRYYEALYRIFDRVHERYPHLLLENCSSGGGRADLGMMSRFHWTQITDNWSPAPTLKIVNGQTLALAPEVCETLLGAISDGVADLDFMLRVGLFGHFCLSGIFPTMAERQMTARERYRHMVHLYKTFVRPMLATCRMFHHTPIQRQGAPGDWVVLECGSEDGQRAYAGIFRLAGAEGEAYLFHPRSLDLSRRYRVTYDTDGHRRQMDGGVLTDQGLRVVVPSALTSELLLFEAE